MTDPARPVSEQQVHRALASPVRARMLEELRGEPGLDVAALAERFGLHVNTVRTHLNLLQEAGLVEAVVEERDRPGRPRLFYRAARYEQPETSGHDSGYRFLARILASYLGAISEDTPAAAEEAGRAWGGYVVDGPAPYGKLTADEAIRRLVVMLDEFGFSPELDLRDHEAPRLVLRRCPFLDVARDHQDVVCSVHLGLMRGALDEFGVDVEARDLIPWAEPDTCVAHLQVQPDSG